MNRDYIENEEKMIKARKNLVYVSMFSIIMMFGGLTSAYIVSMGDSFWLKLSVSAWPKAFWVSTGLMLLGSISIQLALFFVKKGKVNLMKIMISTTFLFALTFIYSQYIGYLSLADNGIHLTGSGILVKNGKYGDYFKIKYQGNLIKVDGNNFLINETKMNENEIKKYQNFMSNFLLSSFNESKEYSKKEFLNISKYGDEFEIFYLNSPLKLIDGKLFSQNHGELKYTDRIHLSNLAKNVRDLRGDFYVKGELGKDFHIYYKGEELAYNDRQLMINGLSLPPHLQNKSEESKDTASSYLWLITVLHLLHVVVTILYIFRLVINSYTGKINQQVNISLHMGAIFWHFLGLLWLYLFLFLLFIH